MRRDAMLGPLWWALMVVLVAGCSAAPVVGPSGAPLPLGVGGPAVGGPAVSGPAVGGPALAAPLVVPPDLTFVIPRGTAAAEMRGEASFTIPDELHVVAGQGISIRNDDQAMHYFADAPIAPGQTYRRTFGRQGVFGYSAALSCSITAKRSLTVHVDGPNGAPQPTIGR
ncbi:MAG: hypothetical protein IT305_32710 [Chloroflexi bacterium]|nr:hypothetical protein [Chloroflexota bacterium]